MPQLWLKSTDLLLRIDAQPKYAVIWEEKKGYSFLDDNSVFSTKCLFWSTPGGIKDPSFIPDYTHDSNSLIVPYRNTEATKPIPSWVTSMAINKINAGHPLQWKSMLSLFFLSSILYYLCSVFMWDHMHIYILRFDSLSGCQNRQWKVYFPVCGWLMKWLIYLLPPYSPLPHYPGLFQPLPLHHFHSHLQK